MAECGAGEEAAGAGKPPRPTITLPPRSSLESLFRGGGASGGSGSDSRVSPGPLTLVSSFFADDPDTECRSFTQLLVGAMNSPAAAARRQEEEKAAESGSGGGSVRAEQSRAVSRMDAFTIPSGLSPASLLDSPVFFSSAPGGFGMSHQAALAQVTAQAPQIKMPDHVEPPESAAAFDSAECSHSDPRSTPPQAIVADKPTADGYSWRKYGQKMVKGSEFPRSYYKCSHQNCPVKKKIEHSADGQVTEIIYRGQHNHQPPKSNKRSKEGGSDGHREVLKMRSLNGAAAASDEKHLSDHRTVAEQLSGLSDGEEASASRMDEKDDGCDANAKRMKVSVSSQASSSESRIVVQTTSEVDLLDDGYRWRKYGQKVVKGNPNPRSYYKCTYNGCSVRKHIERAAADPREVITTYEGKHNHDAPTSRNSSSQTKMAAANSTFIQSSNHFGISKLKEEHETAA